MARALHLGAEGEEAAEHLLDTYDLSSIFEPCLLISPHRESLDEIRRRLAEKAARLEHLEPGEDLASRVQELAAKAAEGDARPVIWLQQKSFDPEPWSHALAVLNQQRELFRAKTPWMWILAGPPELAEIVHDKAMHVLTGISVRRTIHEAPRALVAAPARPIRWLHLSDFHFQALERWDRRAILKALLRHAAELKDRDLAPDFVFITGDVAWSGQRQEYEQAERFFTELAEALGLEPREHFFLVPGNHDVDRGAIGPADGSIIDGLKSQEAIERVLEDPRTMSLLARRLDAFYGFTERFLGAARGWRADRPWRVDMREVAGIEVGILQLSSAWASGRREEQGKLLVGEVQVQKALEEAEDAFLRIALVHHPIADLADVDRERLETRLGAPGGVHFLLRGHLHRSRTITNRTPDGQLTELAAGAVYTHGGYPRRYFLTETDLALGEARVHFFGYSAEGRGFWAPDTQAYEGARDGVWSFALPPDLKLDAEAAIPEATPLSKARRNTLTARYRAAAAAVHGTVRFVGFSGSRPRPNVQVSDLFVPLHLRRHVESDETWTTRELLRRLLDRSDKEHSARMVVLGDPGSGKTTLCRLAAVVVSGEHPIEGLESEGEPLPLYLPFREYVRRCREEGDCSIVAFLSDQARHHLQVPLPEPFLEEVLDRGRAVLLLDGLDEVGSAAEREEMRERVQAFCRGYPEVPALVTSRVAGYHDAPLARTGSGSFRHLEVLPLDDEDLRLFVSHWYAVQEPEDPVARDRGIAGLMAALEVEPRVRELARNPMLATLIALVHRHEAHLPGERAALYDLCVKTFLETWPAARRRRFHQIDERLQRAYLEALAYRMQSSRKTEQQVTIGRRELVTTLVEVVGERQDSSGPPEEAQRLLERWVQFLEAGTGLLVEQRPGVFAFFHLSLMEFLAACGMEKAENDLTAEIADHHSDAVWREVCLLAIGNRATDKAFLDRLFEQLSGQEAQRQRWSFLLLAMREEAAFDDQQRAAILRGTGRDFIGKFRWQDDWSSDQRTLDEIMRFSVRHGAWARIWVEKEVATTRGPELRAIVAVLGGRAELLETLRRRPDAGSAAADLLDFWPGSSIVGNWAVAAAEPAAALAWAQTEAPLELKTVRSITALTPPGEHIAAPLLAGLVHWGAYWRSCAGRWAELLDDQPRNGEPGLPSMVRVEPGLSTLGVLPEWPTEADFGEDIAERLLFASELELVWTGTHRTAFPDVRYSNPAGTPGSYCFMGGTAHDFANVFTRRGLADAFSSVFAGDFPRMMAGEFADEFSPIHDSQDSKIRRIEPDNGESRALKVLASPVADLAVSQLTPRLDRETELESWNATVADRLAAEAWIALVTAINQPRDKRVGYIQHRAQNAWLLHVWPAVDELLGEDPSADALALYLGLGWTQATTTWQWPATERWIVLLSAAPPEHWLPRSQWHLCWLLHDREDHNHRQALEEALEEGLADEDRPGVASSLRSTLLGTAE